MELQELLNQKSLMGKRNNSDAQYHQQQQQQQSYFAWPCPALPSDL
jgi:hypothetical protein